MLAPLADSLVADQQVRRSCVFPDLMPSGYSFAEFVRGAPFQQHQGLGRRANVRAPTDMVSPV